jgi:GNAT superfamily N-acetyltransferase
MSGNAEGSTATTTRRADSNDAAAIARVLYSSFLEFRSAYTEEAFAATAIDTGQVIRRMREGPIWVAERDHRVVGTVSACREHDTAYIRGMAVCPTVRGSGAGVRLLEEAERWAANESCSWLLLSTTPFLHPAIRLYERYGFRCTNDSLGDLCGTPLFRMKKSIGSTKGNRSG